MTDSEIIREAHVITYPRYRDVYDEFDRLNGSCFDGELPTLPIRHGIMSYGKCRGFTQLEQIPIISLATNIMPDPQQWRDTLIHEMIHAWLMLRSEKTGHNFIPWCREITRITPLLGMPPIQAAPTKQRRVDGKVCWVTPDRSLTRMQLATWPNSIRHTQLQVTH